MEQESLITTEATSTPHPTPVEFITGMAGSGKSHTLRARLEADPDYAILSGSTGIAAVNMNSVTINSLLGFYDYDSLFDAYMSGAINRKLTALRVSGVKNVVIDEVSMFPGEALDLLLRAFDEVNESDLTVLNGKPPLGLILVGDACQLPPIKAKWFFQSASWERFAPFTTRLTKNWRQGESRFLDALNFIRAGKGMSAVQVLDEIGVTFNSTVDTDFPGTTLLAKNDAVDRFNQIRLDRAIGEKFYLASKRWAMGKVPGEWKNIPERLEMKVGAYVMILSNSYDFAGASPDDGSGGGGKLEMVYANGDCGEVIAHDAIGVKVRLVRTGKEVLVTPVIRAIESKGKPDGWPEDATVTAGEYLARPHIKRVNGRRVHVSGQCMYYPLRLAYATSVHKSQGLSLDRVQIDFRDGFFGMSGMLYVALSRCRTVEGLRLVGSRAEFVKRVKLAKELGEWV